MTETTSPRADASAAHRLPYTVEPRRYDLRLAPNLDDATFAGEVRIDAVVAEPTGEIVLHAADLTIDAADVSEAGGAPRDLSATLDEAHERLILTPTAALAPGPVTITLRFAGTLNDQLRGFYRSEFTDGDGTTRTIATTQFEATDARRAFPCFDEPDRKAVFGVTLDVSAGHEAFSNGAEIDRSPLPGGGRRVRFADTIPMSTYLVAFVVGPLVASAPVDAGGTPIRVIHVPGKEHLTAFSLEAAVHALEFFSNWFGIPYPAEKLDLVAIPDFAFGAMENLGCVTFREALLLVDPARASRLELERIADVISHEIAHMWFGDLVTMKWWNGIWLNEAFATLMELLCVDHYRPEWQRWVSFGMERDAAMATDALHSTRPVEYPVGPPEEAQGMFDVLTYQKGASVLRMLERFLGPERFRDGIRRYLERHRLANTETQDLWNAIEEASGEPVGEIMTTWIDQGGFPLVSVTDADGGTGQVAIAQEPFFYAPGDATSAIGSRWAVPVMARALGGAHARLLLREQTATLDVPGGAGPVDAARPPTVVVNAGGAGYFRVRYSPAHLRRLAAALGTLEALERFNLVGDTWAAVVAGRAPLDDFLTLAEALGAEGDPDVWAQVTGALSFLDHAVDDDVRPLLARYARALLGPAFARLGWEPSEDEEERTKTLRGQLLGALGTVGQDDEVRAEALRRHREARAGGRPLDPNLASSVVTVVAAGGGPDEFAVLYEGYRNPATPQDEMRYLLALAWFGDPALAARAFELARTEVRTQNAPFLIATLLAHRDNGAGTWGRLRDAWDELLDRIPANIVPRMLDSVKLLCRNAALSAEIREFLDAHPVPSGQRTLQQTLERLAINVAFAGRLRATAAPALSAGIERLGAR